MFYMLDKWLFVFVPTGKTMQEQIYLTYIDQMKMDIQYKEAKLAIILQKEGAARMLKK